MVSPPKTAPTAMPATPTPPSASPTMRCVLHPGCAGAELDGAAVAVTAAVAVALAFAEAVGAADTASASGGMRTVVTPAFASTFTVVDHGVRPGAVTSIR